MRRVTLGAEMSVEGTGLFTGAPARVTLHPATPGSGVRFRRDGQIADAHVSALKRDPGARNTTLGIGVMMIEHLMSALAGLGVTDVLVDVEGPEIPAGDGSSLFLVDAINRAGLVELDGEIKVITPTEPLRVEDAGGATIEITPSDRVEYVYDLDFGDNAHLIADQRAEWNGDAAAYAREIAPARTFCLEAEAIAMRERGLFAHLTARDMLVIGEDGPIENSYRFDNEPARHKLLDLVGDLALAGAPIRARVHARRAGHALNHEMAALLAGRTPSASSGA